MRILLGSPLSIQCGLRFLRRTLPSKRALASLSKTADSLPPKPRSNPLDKFDPKQIEHGWYNYWSSRSLFEPDDSPNKPIRMLLPPPNVTGQLHIGHALMLSIQDALARYYRMNNHPVHWAPGTDHAGIATQLVVERMLERERGVTRKELGRQGLVEEIEKWREEYGRRILGQISRLGTSTTNSKEYYTLDKGLSEAVTNAFVELYKEGLVYRDTRMVNWCVDLQTAVSDIEVVSVDVSNETKINGVEYGVLHSFAFPLVDGSGEIVVSTTRPETIPGDCAVAVHPDDERYKHLHYSHLQHPLLPHVTLPIIPDALLVDPAFGTGAVKVTPAHDTKDYEFWKRHASSSNSSTSSKLIDIPLSPVFSTDGHILPSAGIPSLVGIDRLHARKSVVRLLEEAGVYRGKKNHEMRIATCERSGGVIEPLLQPQWYLKTKPLAQKVLQKCEDEAGLVIRPEIPYAKEWQRWLSGIEDWCLSRQIWWGHRIPAYRIIRPDSSSSPTSSTTPIEEKWIVAPNLEAAKSQLRDNEKEYVLEQDPDVLDTWFSSGLLPLSTAGWRGNEAEGKEWREGYPLSFIESGGDILFFWLARMAMLGTHFSNKLPFNEIILHPLVCDSKGRKMSKSVGNVLDPLAIIEGRTLSEIEKAITNDFKEELKLASELELEAEASETNKQNKAKKKRKEIQRDIVSRIKAARKDFPEGITESGADPLRMALIDYTRQARQINLDLRHVDTFRRLSVKIYNASKFCFNALVIARKESPEFKLLDPKSIFSGRAGELTFHDQYMLYHLKTLIEICNKAFKERKLYKATEGIREFTVAVFCDIYLEFIKREINITSNPERTRLALSLLTYGLETILLLSHPLMPFLTETLWQNLDPASRANIDNASIMKAPYPSSTDIPEIEKSQVGNMDVVIALVNGLRRYNNGNGGRSGVCIAIEDGELKGYIRRNLETISRMSKLVVEDVVDIGGLEVLFRGIEEVVVGVEEGNNGWKKHYQKAIGNDGDRTVFVWTGEDK